MKAWPTWNLGLKYSDQRKQTVVTLRQECVWYVLQLAWTLQRLELSEGREEEEEMRLGARWLLLLLLSRFSRVQLCATP